MCRFLVYRGPPGRLSDWLLRPEHSLIRQSYRATEMAEPLNGDGFGVGWYSPGEDPTPCVFTSLRPAWSDRNLRRLSVHVRSGLFFAHVRAATPPLTVDEASCHPFRLGRFLWMHNGKIAGFSRIKRAIQSGLREDLYDRLLGNTDSEHAFFLFLDALTPYRARVRAELERDPVVLEDYRREVFDLQEEALAAGLGSAEFLDLAIEHLGAFAPDELTAAMRVTIARLRALTRASGAREASYYNFAMTDGRTLVVTRYADDHGSVPPTLYYSGDMTGRDPETGREEPAIVVASEPLTEVHDAWHPLPSRSMLVIDPRWGIEMYDLEAEVH